MAGRTLLARCGQGGRKARVLLLAGLALVGSAFLGGGVAGADTTYDVTTAANAGAGSLRQAITDSNTAGGTNTITFHIGSGAQTITLGSALPALSANVTLDGSTQPGYTTAPMIAVDGNKLF